MHNGPLSCGSKSVSVNNLNLSSCEHLNLDCKVLVPTVSVSCHSKHARLPKVTGICEEQRMEFSFHCSIATSRRAEALRVPRPVKARTHTHVALTGHRNKHCWEGIIPHCLSIGPCNQVKTCISFPNLYLRSFTPRLNFISSAIVCGWY